MFTTSAVTCSLDNSETDNPFGKSVGLMFPKYYKETSAKIEKLLCEWNVNNECSIKSWCRTCCGLEQVIRALGWTEESWLSPSCDWGRERNCRARTMYRQCRHWAEVDRATGKESERERKEGKEKAKQMDSLGKQKEIVTKM